MAITYLLLLKRYSTIILILTTIILSIGFNDLINLDLKIKLYTISHLIRSILMFLIPLLILPFFIYGIMSIKKHGVYFIPIILLLVWLSNLTALMIPYLIGCYFIPHFKFNNKLDLYLSQEETITSLYDWILPELLTLPEVLLLGLIIGLLSSYWSSNTQQKILGMYYNISYTFFTKIFMPIIPLYILGTMLKIGHEIDFHLLIPIFGKMVICILLIQSLYIYFLFLLGNGSFKQTLTAIKNALPAALVGFSTMSSLITLPVTLNSAEKNTAYPDVAKLTVSSTVNCHDVGESISLPIVALTIIYITTLTLPTFSEYSWFILLLSLAQFSGASIPGGSIVIMLPLLVSCFNFTDEMSSLMIALSIILDPIGTANNVMGNSAFAIIIDRLYGKFFTKFNLKKTL